MSHDQCICAECERDRNDAMRYRWLRQRMEIRTHQSLSGVVAPAMQVRVGCSFFNSKTVERNKPRDYSVLDAAIDAACLSAQNSEGTK